MGGVFCKPIDKFIYRPPDKSTLTSSVFDSKSSRQFYLTSRENVRIHVVVVDPIFGMDSDKMIIWSHGNGTDNYAMLAYCKFLANRLNIRVVTYDYPGYGLSQDCAPTESKCYQSLDTVVAYFIEKMQVGIENIYLIGQSLGTGIVVDYAAKHAWTTPLILISPYTSICRVVSETSCLRPVDRFKTINKTGRLRCPVKIFHGVVDELIDPTHALKIYHSLADKTFEPTFFDNFAHNDILDAITPQHYDQIINYMDQESKF